MKKLSLLLVMMSAAFMTLAGNTSRLVDPEDVYGDEFHIYQRSTHGSAVNPVTHTFMVPQDGVMEITGWDGLAFAYIKNIVYGSEREFGDYWVEAFGDQEGGFNVQMGQIVAERDRDGSRYKQKAVLVWGTLHYEAATNQTSFTPNTEVSWVSYSADGNTIILEDTSGPVAIEAQDDVSYDATGLGIVWEDEEGEVIEWAGYCEWGTEMDTEPYIIDYQPEGELKTYTRTSDCIHFSDFDIWTRKATTFSTEALTDEGQIVFANDGHTVYLKDPFLSMAYGTWVIGTLNEDGTVITVDVPQYLYAYNANNTYAMIHAGSCNAVVQNSDRPNDYLLNEIEYGFGRIKFLIDGNTITMQDTWADLDAAYPENFYASGIIIYDNTTEVGSVEANIVYTLKSDQPTVQTIAPDISGYASEDGQSHYVVIVPGEPSTIYYNVVYPDGTTTSWAEYIDVLNFTGEGTYTINAYAIATDKLPSEQDHYEFTISPSPVTGITETTIGKEIVNRRYFNVMGQEIEQPEGMTIIVTTYTDGSTTAVKTVK